MKLYVNFIFLYGKNILRELKKGDKDLLKVPKGTIAYHFLIGENEENLKIYSPITFIKGEIWSRKKIKKLKPVLYYFLKTNKVDSFIKVGNLFFAFSKDDILLK